jgi:hypothetical protein
MTLAELRAHLAALKSRAAAKIAEVADGMAAEAVRAIETDHADLVRQVRETETKIEAAEAAERGAPAPSATAIAAERARAAEINTLAARHSMPAEFVARHIADGTSLDQVRGLVLDAVAERAAGTTANPRVQVITDEGDTVRDAIEVAIMHRANPRLVELTDAARAWRGMSLMEMGRTFVEDTQGVKLRGLGRMELAGALLGMPTNLRSGGPLTTSDFPNLLANVISKRLRSRQNNAPDFKARAIVQLSNMPNLKPVKEGGEFTRMALADSKESYSLSTFGRVITLSRQSLINDDLSAFDRIPMLFGRAAAETEAALFWAIVTSNPNMGDGVALFHANHGNLAASGSAIAIASLSAGRKAMRKQKGLAAKASDAEPLNLAPAFIVVSPDKETEAQQFLATTLYPQQNAQVNPFAGSLLQITEARLTGNAWYLFADPATIDTIEYAYLDGEEGLYTESRLGFDVDGVEVKGRLDFAAKAIDWRGMYQDPGA